MKTILLFIAIVGVFTCHSQDIKMCGYQGYQTVEEVESACDLQDANRSENNTEDAEQVVDAILDKVGLFRNFLIEECENINNALAVTMPLDGGDIDRYILYDIEFFKKVSSSTGTDWGLTSILAHEVGHHLNGHTLKSGGSNHKVELQADEFSGFVLARMKCSLEDAQSAVSKLLPDEASSTHPAKQDRLDAIAKGWNRGNGKIINVKKIEENNSKDEITGEMVLANYIEAIGGQEKVASIKTFYKEELMYWNMPFRRKYSYLSPSKVYLESYIGSSTLKNETLTIVDKEYRKWNGDKRYQLATDKYKNLPLQNNKDKVSYVPEHSLLVRNVEAKYIGVKVIDSVSCYAVSIAPVKYSKKYFLHSYKYFDVKTGLLYCEDNYHVRSKTLSQKRKNKIKYDERVYYLDYRSIDGVLFSYFQKVNFQGKDRLLTLTNEVKKIKINPIINQKLFEID